jgi:hypothetical protein
MRGDQVLNTELTCVQKAWIRVSGRNVISRVAEGFRKDLALWILFLLSLPATAELHAQSYSIRPIAGEVGFGTSDGTNSQARLNEPEGIAVDSQGTVYVADTLNHTIRKLVLTGSEWVASTIAGTPGITGSADGTNGQALFNKPVGITVGLLGELYIADSMNHTIRKLTPLGNDWASSTIAGLPGASGTADGTNSDARFNTPLGIGTSTNGALYVGDSGNNTIRRITNSGGNWMVTTLAGAAGIAGNKDGTNETARFRAPADLTVDASGNLFVSDSHNQSVRKVSVEGVVTTIAGLNSPRGISVDRNGNLFVAEASNYVIRKITPNGLNWVATTIAGAAGLVGSADGTNQNARFALPYGLASDANSTLFVADLLNNTIRKIAPAGTNWITTTMIGVPGEGTTDGTNSTARFYSPAGIATDGTGTFYVSDMQNSVIRKIVHQGSNWIVTTIAGTATPGNSGSRSDGTNEQARFFWPQGLALDAAGNLFVADSANRAIREIKRVGSDWVTTTLSTSFAYPNGLALDNAGSVYVADYSGNDVKRMTRSGTTWVVSTIAGSLSGSSDGTNTFARFNGPNGVAIDAATNLYIADQHNNAIRLIQPIDTNWVVTTIAGSPGSTAATLDGTNRNARFMLPNGVALDPQGNLYVTEFTALRKVTHVGTNWIVTTVTGPGTVFNEANSLIVDSASNLYITDTFNNVISLGLPLVPLTSTLVNNHLVLSWPLAASNYILETTATLDVPGWVQVPNGMSIFGEQFFWTNESSENSGFFRLRR